MAYSRWPAFTATRLRPLARRRDSTARPLLVFMRERNPCVFERRRRLGWNVRLGIENCAPSLAQNGIEQTQSIAVNVPHWQPVATASTRRSGVFPFAKSMQGLRFIHLQHFSAM